MPHVTRYVVIPRNSLYYVHVIDLVQAAQVVTGDVSVSGFPGRAARREIPRSRGFRQRCDDWLAEVGATRGL